MRPPRHVLVAVCLLMTEFAIPAAGQDKKVLGVELGTRFLVSPCGRGDGAFPSRPCVVEPLPGRTPWGAQEYHLRLPSAGTPAYVRGELKVFTVDGIVESVQISTWGIEAQYGAFDSLRNKYGEPTRARQEKQKGLRARLPTKFAEWDFNDFSVKLDGTTGSIDWGRIEFSSQRYRKLLDDFEKRAAGASR